MTTVSAAIAAHAAAERYEFLRLEYSRTARELEHLLSRWKRSKLSDDEFVMKCESVISVQNEAWMAKLSRKSRTPEPVELSSRARRVISSMARASRPVSR